MITVYFDIDTQIDFLFPAGALYVPGAEKLIRAIGRLNRHASASGNPLISSMCAHSENDPEFRQWPPHCIAGTVGQLKPAELLVEHQTLLEKNQLDIFSSPNLAALLERLAADRYLVYGVVTEYCVRLCALGLLRLGKPVSIVTDAIQTLDAPQGASTLREFTSAGGGLTTVAEVCGQ
ncbi:MAG: cysteine hydrolase [Candidatus Solibacter usitatus]|nr:cysteine hydrolase [Candidatus Solibacter usitatus]